MDSLTYVHWTHCQNLKTIGLNSFRGNTHLKTLDLSACNSVTTIGHAAFYFCNQLHCVIFPASLQSIAYVAFESGYSAGGSGNGTVPSPVQTIIWKGRSERSNVNIDNAAFYSQYGNLDKLVQDGLIREIFVP